MTCSHIFIRDCPVCRTVYCEICGKEWGEGYEIDWELEEELVDNIIRRNYACNCRWNNE